MSYLKAENDKNIFRFWPILTAIPMFILNIDLAVIPSLRKMHVAGLELLAIACILSTIELAFWYWFWGWVIRTLLETRNIKESIEFGKQLGGELKKEGYIDRIRNFFVQKFDKAMDGKNKVVKLIKAGGGLSLFFIGASPESGSRIIGIIFCRTMKWKTGFYSLALGNLLHVCYVVAGWSFIFSLF